MQLTFGNLLPQGSQNPIILPLEAAAYIIIEVLVAAIKVNYNSSPKTTLNFKKCIYFLVNMGPVLESLRYPDEIANLGEHHKHYLKSAHFSCTHLDKGITSGSN